MIIEKHKIIDVSKDKVPDTNINRQNITEEEEIYSTNALAEAYKAVRSILLDIKLNENDPNSPPLFKTVKLDNGQLNRIKNSKLNEEYAMAFPAVLIHFVNVYYNVGQSRIGEGKATMRIHYILNRQKALKYFSV